MRSVGIFFLGEILHHRVAQRTFGARGQHPQMFRERFDVAVVLRRVELQRLTAELAGLPILIKGMIQQVPLRDCRVEPG